MSYYDRPWSQNDSHFGDQYLTPAVRKLILANVAIFIVQVILYGLQQDGIYSYFALIPKKVIENLWVWQLVSYGFLHSLKDIIPTHLIFNLLALFFFGHYIERRYGSKKFYIFYFVTIAFSGFIHCVIHYAKNTAGIPTIGASGGIMGILALTACLYPNLPVYFFMIIPMRLRTLILILIGLDVYITIRAPYGGIATIVHLSGALFGYLFYKFSPRVFHYFESLERKMERDYNQHQRKKTQSIRKEVDRLLDKINKEGLPSLTKKEKEFLRKASKEYQAD